ncbi:TPA: hypothetical protein DIC62_03450 [Candidatus Nomurabacteria bacterium]|nr:hypothetical protein [Candidatus Nomurabacteria bacterium]
MKRVFALSSVLIGVVFLTGCGQQSVSQTNQNNYTTNSKEGSKVSNQVEDSDFLNIDVCKDLQDLKESKPDLWEKVGFKEINEDSLQIYQNYFNKEFKSNKVEFLYTKKETCIHLMYMVFRVENNIDVYNNNINAYKDFMDAYKSTYQISDESAQKLMTTIVSN